MFGTKIPQWAVFAGAAVAVGGALYLDGADAQLRAPGYVKDLRAISAQLAEADRVGDRALAFAQMEAATGLIQRMSQDPAPPHSKRYCVLAAEQLLKATLDVHEGGTWGSKARFDAAMQDCE
jgi:hypothetical protein